jgi:hypothetical protein
MRYTLACLFVLLPASAARAVPQRVLMLAPRVEIELDAAQRAALNTAVVSALKEQGVELVAHTANGVAPPACQELACIEQQLQAHGADHAFELAVWRAVGGGIGGVSVVLTLVGGARYSEGANVESTVAAAISGATTGAYARLRRGPGPWLEVTGSPEGAEIWIDGARAGVVPQRVRVLGGLHHLVVRHPGFEAHDETITVARNHDAWKNVSVALQPVQLANTQGRESIPADGASWLNYALGAASVGVGVWLGVGPLRSAARDGECGREENAQCIGVVRFDAGEAVQLAAAGLLIAGGVTFALWSPLRVRAGRDYALIEARARF